MFFLSSCIKKGVFQYIVKLYLCSTLFLLGINDDISYFTLGSLEFFLQQLFLS